VRLRLARARCLRCRPAAPWPGGEGAISGEGQGCREGRHALGALLLTLLGSGATVLTRAARLWGQAPAAPRACVFVAALLLPARLGVRAAVLGRLCAVARLARRPGRCRWRSQAGGRHWTALMTAPTY